MENMHYLRAMGVDNSMIDSLSRYDFSETDNIGFVYSIPGSHQGESLSRAGSFMSQWKTSSMKVNASYPGYSGLGTTVSALV
ncbi:hypothetical protein J3459_016101 [Metarhizium acridum]|nr:hypothetical protein J3459_016101 [Metarhizium acridum]